MYLGLKQLQRRLQNDNTITTMVPVVRNTQNVASSWWVLRVFGKMKRSISPTVKAEKEHNELLVSSIESLSVPLHIIYPSISHEA